MAANRRIEIFSAGCPVCRKAIETVEDMACPSCEVVVLDMNDADVAARAEREAIERVPAILIDGKVADCCAGDGPDEEILRHAGIGQPL